MTVDENTDSNESIKNEEKKKILRDNIVRGYITGFFDAEGMIRVENDGTPTVSIKQTYKPVLDYINSIFFGSVTRYNPLKTDHKVSFRLNILYNDKIRFLEYIYPNLIEKRKQAELMLYYLRQIKPSRRDYFKLSETQRQQRKWISGELERLKHEKCDELELKNYENEIKKLHIPKDIREGRQSTLLDLGTLYRELGIDENEKQIIESNSHYNIPEDIFIGYMAGFFDGEGYVGICKGKRDSYTLRIALTNSNFDILNKFKNRFYGKIRPKSSHKDTKDFHKKLWLWELFNDDSLLFLKKIYQHTKVKKEQIYYAIKFQEFHNSVRIINTSERKDRAEYYLLKLKELKKETGEDIESCKVFTKKNLEEEQMSIEKAWLI